jgi:hypothetical protein
MDAERQLRFAVAPFFLFGSLLAGAMLADVVTPNTPAELGSEVLVAIAGIALGSTLPIGFLIGSVTQFALWIVFRIAGRTTHEAVFDSVTETAVFEAAGNGDAGNRRSVLYAAVVFDHEIMPQGLHQWIMRRWTAFNISVNSLSACALALLIGPLVGVPFTRLWVLASLVVCLPLAFQAVMSWRQTMGMFRFHAARNPPPPGTGEGFPKSHHAASQTESTAVPSSSGRVPGVP